jgi:hypothetical protein
MDLVGPELVRDLVALMGALDPADRAQHDALRFPMSRAI